MKDKDITDSSEYTGSPSISITTYFSDNKKAAAFVKSINPNSVPDSRLTTTITQGKSGGCCVTTVIEGLWAATVIQEFSDLPPNIWN